MKDLILRDEVFGVVGAAIEVHQNLGSGFLESVYAEAMAVELRHRNIPFEREVPIRIHYKGQRLDKRFQADLLVYGQLIVELKALERITSIERAQVVNYLKAAHHPVGLLINFGSHPKMEWERLVHQAPT
jgi:GxxExxY protein